MALEAQLHALNREHNNQAFLALKLKDEIQDMRRQKERAVVEKEAAALHVERKSKDVQAEEMQMSSMVESLSRKNRFLLRELDEAQRVNEEQYAQLIKANSDRSMLADQMEGLRKATSLEKQITQRQMEEAMQRLEEALAGLREELHDRECQVAELHMTHQEQVARLVEAQDARLSQAEAESAEKVREARRHQMELQAKLDAMKDTCEEHRLECEDYKRQANLQAEAATREIQRLQAQLADAEQQAGAKVAEIQELRLDLAKATAEAKDLGLSNGHLSRRKEELDLQVKRLQQEIQEAVTERQALSKDLEDTRKSLLSEQAAQLAHLESTRQSANVERKAVSQKYQAGLKDQQSKHEGEMRVLKKQLRNTRAEVVQLTDELLQVKMRSHELEAALSGLSGPMRSLAAAGGRGVLGDIGPQQDVGSGSGVVGADMIASMAALKQRQQKYMEAVGCA
ncbi:hypothetical protein DUNSADRAFT_12060 [Dunaliella salina]|uniref:Uncharacterized protein n=1 Tax=Dunaliella salina TaxID=3046 RepID=A0ABQ7H422_DUNSA|nr:hypothetical protein DUNSADRAFT_12060 [Dunaliella salina]|eukprot:KAF5841604.1 hypothetical protein DUNSADRAFT_12060 [Dunaliella salina]